ncbi:hypothetical protein RRG08_041821 [Elysia crispata]|uniref:Uncharacterized protein n=1 Tax=Elysia crispata TaxID=231223 RepID=A0AAE0Y1G3_9GAST|nr:hypothetical protein RRG08_041821 [Elysia crispata]
MHKEGRRVKALSVICWNTFLLMTRTPTPQGKEETSLLTSERFGTRSKPTFPDTITHGANITIDEQLVSFRDRCPSVAIHPE